MIPALDLSQTTAVLAQYMVGMLRIGAFLVASPVFGGRFVPLPVRIIATAVITLPVMIWPPLPPTEQIAGLNIVPIAAVELMIGLSAGLLLTILFGAASVAGDRIASTAGLGFAAQFDPASGGQTPVVASIFSLFLLSAFIGSDGHLIAIRLVLESYRVIPIGGPVAFDIFLAGGIDAAKQMFEISAAIMLPIILVLLLLNIVIGILTRSAPQLNVFSFGFPVTMGASMLLIYLFAPSLIQAFSELIQTSLSMLSNILGQPFHMGQ